MTYPNFIEMMKYSMRRWIVVIIKCIKRRIENSSGILCSGIEPKSIALHNQNTIEGLIGKSISQCFKSPCTGPRVTTFQGLAKYANPCNIRYPIDKEALETQCPNFLQLANCVVSKIGDETNETCLAKEKISTARGFSDLIPQDAANVSLCISKMSEFPVDAPNEDVTTMGQLLETNVNQTPLIVGIVLAVFFVFIIILIVSLITMRKMLLKKRRKELLRLPSLPKTKESPYEANFTSPNDTYIDPDYEMIEEQDEGYKHLGEQRGGSYIDPDNADGTYLDVVPTSNEKSDGSYINVNPYIEVIDDATENNSVTEAHQEVLLPVENSENSENMTSN
ncbi:uncharacterized protein LOC134261627 [Saccostrea cucullata]|uniref:uncharacterized protein LOC134261627 n=1 Tax=Saccostrea cuccullata TaxID=36930 RepID=UPI002ED215DF